jgi:2-polyprenyl-3-methyl-5-hydroxy-6-metoxy-1,4-benzoquinol methylase
VLDVGCGTGEVGRELRRLGASQLVGIELEADVAEDARPDYDEVHVGRAEDLLGTLEGPFDTIVCYDVLEHLVDPWAALQRLHALAAPGAHLHVSVPNARHAGLVYDLMLRGTFGYTEWGNRDITHLRWFTPRDIAQAVTDAGWTVISSVPPPLSTPRRLAATATRGRAAEFLVWQWQVLARR